MSDRRKHINHLYDDKNLTFKEIKEIINLINSHQIEVFEKFDGANLLFCKNNNRLLVARSNQEILSGGLTLEQLNNKFYDRPKLAKMFCSAYVCLNDILNLLEHDCWMSCEIVDPENPNTFIYSRKAIVFHQELKETVLPEKLNEYELLEHKPVQLNSLNFSTINNINHKINMEIIGNRISEDETIEKYLFYKSKKYIKSLFQKFSTLQTEHIASLVLERKTKISNNIFDNKQEKVIIKQKILDNSNNLLKELISPIEKIIYNAACLLFSGITSKLSKPLEEFHSDIEKIVELNTENKEMQKLGPVNSIDHTIEGVVFNYKNNIYKLTGVYTPINRIRILNSKKKKIDSKIEEEKPLYYFIRG